MCVDATHETNQYSFLLITIMVIDQFGEGVPVAWCITTREDTVMLKQFFKSLREKSGSLVPSVFMSDDASQYWNAWSSIYGDSTKSTKKLLCAWHIDKSWRKGLQEHVKDVNGRVKLYMYLRTLLLEVDVGRFRAMLQQFMSMIATSEPDFCNYFQRTYSTRADQWATCHRIGMFVNTNMYLESFHRLLKFVYLEGKVNKRLDYLISILLKVAKNKAFEHFQKIHKGKTTHRIAAINKRHRLANDMIVEGHTIEALSDTSWRVKSEKQHDKQYTVSLCEEQRDCTCKIRCCGCNVCIHMYTCSCVDSALHTTVCKHVHVTCILTREVHTSIDQHQFEPTDNSEVQTDAPMFSVDRGSDSTRKEACGPQVIDQQYLSQVLQTPQNQLHVQKDKAISNLSVLQTLMLNATNIDAVTTASQHISNAISIFKTLENSTPNQLTVRKRSAPNARPEKQMRFVSIKKKRISQSSSLTKPTDMEEIHCREILADTEVTVCCICYKEDDKQHGDDSVEWIECSTCEQWVHKHATCSTRTNLNDYMCKNCL